MAQETSSSDQKALEVSAEPELTRTGSSSRLNAKAPEFVPRTSDRVVVPIHHHPHPIHVFHPASPGAAYYAATTPQFEYYGGFVENDVVTGPVEPDPSPSQPQAVAGKEGRDGLSDDVIQKITKQVRFV
jgi:La-related protein 7